MNDEPTDDDDDELSKQIEARLTEAEQNTEALDESLAEQLHVIGEIERLATITNDVEELRKLVQVLVSSSRTTIRMVSKTQQALLTIVTLATRRTRRS